MEKKLHSFTVTLQWELPDGSHITRRITEKASTLSQAKSKALARIKEDKTKKTNKRIPWVEEFRRSGRQWKTEFKKGWGEGGKKKVRR